ncbi:MAG TPA: GAF domain-containing protein [Rhizomicrobium sp.]|jgi:GAF domain-containing protein|nr:GAF domain-containing protein [Rhizomicrobium sp.]
MQVKYDPDFAVRRKLLRLLRDGLAGAEQLHDIVEIVRRAARAIFSADGVAFVLNEDGHCHYVEENAIAPLWKGLKFPMEHCISGWAMIHGQTAAIENVYQDDRIPHDVYRQTFVASLIMVPVSRTAPVAAIGAYWRIRQKFSAEMVALAEELAAEVGAAMHSLAGAHPRLVSVA